MNQWGKSNSIPVYIWIDESMIIHDVRSGLFLEDSTGWVKVAEGYGGKYCYAHGGSFFDKSIQDGRGIPRYKLVDGQVVERTQEEMKADYTPQQQNPTAEDLLQALMEGIENA